MSSSLPSAVGTVFHRFSSRSEQVAHRAWCRTVRHVAFPQPRRMAPTCYSQRCFAVGTHPQFEKRLAEEDIVHLQAMSVRIMQDPICELPPEEVQRCLIQRPDIHADLSAWNPQRLMLRVTGPAERRRATIDRYTNLIVDRLDNIPLCEAFDIDDGFNKQVYFMMIHAWLLHQRLVLEGKAAERLDEELFESCWTIVKNWLWLKKVPEYRFWEELRNVQEYMFGCCIALDKALERSDILPARVQQVLWGNVYSGDARKDSESLVRLTKYIIRQLGLMLQIDKEHFLEGNFKWADFPVRGSTNTTSKGRDAKLKDATKKGR